MNCTSMRGKPWEARAWRWIGTHILKCVDPGSAERGRERKRSDLKLKEKERFGFRESGEENGFCADRGEVGQGLKFARRSRQAEQLGGFGTTGWWGLFTVSEVFRCLFEYETTPPFPFFLLLLSSLARLPHEALSLGRSMQIKKLNFIFHYYFNIIIRIPSLRSCSFFIFPSP